MCIRDRAYAVPGELLTYRITVGNAGPSPAGNVVIRDNVPDMLSNVQYSENGINWFPWDGTYEAGTIAAGGNVQIFIRGTVLSNAAGIISNTASVTSDTPDPDPDDNTSTFEIPVEEAADLSIEKRSSPESVTPGDLLTYTLLVANLGPGTAVNVILSDNVPAELQNVQYSSDGGLTWQPWPGIYQAGNLAAGESVQLLVRGIVGPSASGRLINTAVVKSDTPDPDPCNDTSTTETPVVSSADLSISKTASRPSAAPGEGLTYTVDVENKGPSDAENVVVTDNIPSELANVYYSSDGGINWNPWPGFARIGTIAAGQTAELLIRGTVLPTVTEPVTNTAFVVSSTPDPNPDDNSVTIVTPVGQSADLSLNKTASVSQVVPGEEVTYTLTVKNLGPSAAENTVLTDIAPDELENMEFSVDGGLTWQPWGGRYEIGALAPLQNARILIRGTVRSGVVGNITNTGIVLSDTEDPNPANNADTVVITVGDFADVSICKTVCPVSASPRQFLYYTLTVANSGPSDAVNVVVHDTFPAGLTGGKYSVDGGRTWQEWEGSYTIPLLQNGSCVTILLVAVVGMCVCGEIVNTAAVTSDTPDPNACNNQSLATACIRPYCPPCGSTVVKCSPAFKNTLQ